MKDEGSLKDNLRTGRPPVLDTHQRKRLKRFVNNRTGVSQRRLGLQFQVNQTTIGKNAHFLLYTRENSEIYRKTSEKIARIVPETRQFVLPIFLIRDYGR